MSDQDKKKIAILIVGMHRSGTSALARVLNILGCDLPATLLGSNPSNERGHWESKKIVFLNDELLASAGSSWHDWNFFNPQWYASPIVDRFRERARTILEDEYGDSRFFVLKDPRICLLLPFWLDAVRDYGTEPLIISIIRNPLDVAASLETRDGIDPSIGHLLWLRHVLDAEKSTRGFKHAWLRYDTLLSEPHGIVDALADTLDISWPGGISTNAQAEIDEFISKNLRHHLSNDAKLLGNPRLSHWIKSSFEVLDRWARGDAHDKDMEILDRIRSAFDAATPAFSRALTASERALTERDEQIQGLSQTLTERDEQIQGLSQTLTERDEQIQGLNQTLTERDERIQGLSQTLAERDEQIQGLNKTLIERDEQILGANQTLTERDEQIQGLNQTLTERDEQIQGLNQTLTERDEQIQGLNQTLTERDEQIQGLNQALTERDEQIQGLYGSTSWRITAPLRHIRRSSQLVLVKARAGSSWIARTIYRRTPLPFSTKIVLKEILFRLAPALFRHTEAYRAWTMFFTRLDGQAEVTSQSCNDIRGLPGVKFWGILTTRHNLFVAKSIERRLRRHGWDVDLMTVPPDEFLHDYYIVISAQHFEKLPPGEKRIALQVEQGVSLRWFTDDYLNILKSSLAILEYSMHNMSFLKDRGIIYPQVHYLPIGGERHYDDIGICLKKHNVLFYGDNITSPQRQRMLTALRKKFDVVVINDMYGQDMKKAIKSARVVVNLHYYENALLETVRLWECLSLGIPVVSESTDDQDEYPEFKGVVKFFEEGSSEAMLLAVEKALKNPVSKKAIIDSVVASERKFKFMFDRFLVAENFLPASYAYSMNLPLPASADCIAVSMPETVDRRSLFIQELYLPSRCIVFDGFRRQPGLIGCGLSHSALAKHALAYGFKRFTIMEDDVVFPEDFRNKLSTVHRFLDLQSGEWDIFSGVTAEIDPETNVTSVVEFEGITFAIINKVVSTVFNIYSERGLQILASWDPSIADGIDLNIDQLIKRQGNLRVIITCPFLVGHRKNLDSTIQSHHNMVYLKMIHESQQRLAKMISSYKSSREMPLTHS